MPNPYVLAVAVAIAVGLLVAMWLLPSEPGLAFGTGC